MTYSIRFLIEKGIFRNDYARRVGGALRRTALRILVSGNEDTVALEIALPSIGKSCGASTLCELS
ncbi:MAG: hypothetical protein KBS95_03330 [Alistipes sp.]|nr:hypothetical protein [Candidatus Alistipes equi]